jgi:hypothetical protein
MASLPGWNTIAGASSWSKGFAIAGFVALFFVVLFDVLAFIYSERKDVLVIAEAERATEERKRQEEEANRQRSAEIAEANRKAAEARAQAEQLRQEAAPRALSPTERHQISAFLVGKPVGAFVIKATIIAADARAYGEQIADVFRAAGWTVTIQNAMFGGPNITGLWITVKNGNAAPPAAGVLRHALAAGGITVRGEYDPSMPDEVWLSIGGK